MAERGNTTHGSNADDQLKHETQGLIQGNHPTRAEEWRESETIDDGENDGENTADGEQPVYVAETAPGEGTDADDGPLTEPIGGEVRSDEQNNDEEAQ